MFVGEFIFETAYSAGPKAHTDDLSKQQKKKVIFTVELSFPYIKSRIEVLRKREVNTHVYIFMHICTHADKFTYMRAHAHKGEEAEGDLHSGAAEA